MEAGGGAIVLLEQDCTPQALMEQITSLLQDPQRCRQMGAALQKMCVFDSAERLCDIIAQLGGA
jgi:UDP-N-acetylglucosamine:LPS N-acetylglucosamine transferase